MLRNFGLFVSEMCCAVLVDTCLYRKNVVLRNFGLFVLEMCCVLFGGRIFGLFV